MSTTEAAYRVRKDGDLIVATANEARDLVAAGEALGYSFGTRPVVGGHVVSDLDA